MAVPLDPRQLVHVARQPILDADRRVHGYELLYRAQGTDQTCSASGDLAAARVVTDAILAIGLDALAGGVPAFLNVTRQLLLDRAAHLLEGLGLPPSLLPAAYADALRWMRDVSAGMAAA